MHGNNIKYGVGTRAPFLKGEKFMKKFVSWFLALVVLCTGVMMTGCDNGKPASGSADKSVAAVIKDAVKKNEDLDAMSAEMKMQMEMATEGMTMSIPITAKIKAKNLKSDNVISSVNMTTSMLGQEMAMEMYQEGQWAYVVMDDVKYKASLEDMEGEMDYAASAKNMLQEIPEDLLKDVKLVKAEDGSQTATVNFPGEKFSEVYSEIVGDVLAETGTEIGETKISNAVVTITVANGFVTVYDVAFSVDMTVAGVSSTTKAKVTVTYENLGQDVTVTPPEGYGEFEELDLDFDLDMDMDLDMDLDIDDSLL